MPRQPNWTNETTRHVAQLILKLCQPSESSESAEPIDWQQVAAWIEAHRDAAIRKRDGVRKRPKA